MDNPVNARIEDADLALVESTRIWMEGPGELPHRAWAPTSAQHTLTAGDAVTVYLDADDCVNGWKAPGVAVNQRHFTGTVGSPTGGGLQCVEGCGLLWMSPDPAAVIEHGEGCLECGGPLRVTAS